MFFAYIAVEEHANEYVKLMNEELKFEVYSLFDPEAVSSTTIMFLTVCYNVIMSLNTIDF